MSGRGRAGDRRPGLEGVIKGGGEGFKSILNDSQIKIVIIKM
jgi:hypothetical protein